MLISQMNKLFSVFIVLLGCSLFFGCAHRYTEKEYNAVLGDLNSCRESLEASRKDTAILDAKLTEMEKKLVKSSSVLTSGYSEKQDLLDKNIQCMEDNKALLKQISRFKVITQERKDAQWRLDKAHEKLLSSLNSERVNDQLYIIKSEDKVKIVIPQRVLFPTPSSAWLMPKGMPIVKKIAKSLEQLKPLDIEIAGHCDSSPIPRPIMKTYPTQWDLAHARAVSILLALESSGIKKDKLSTVSYADTRPIADPTTEEGNAMNRRVEIIITP
jgi:chemotaxis protein MotB